MQATCEKTSILKSSKPPGVPCAVCGAGNVRWFRGSKIVVFHGREYGVCATCDKTFYDCGGQIKRFGVRFRFVRRSEIVPEVMRMNLDPSQVITLPATKQIYKILLLLKERQEIRQKEVNWMVDEMTERILKLPIRAARIISETFVVCGDDATLSDDVALMQIRDLIEEINPDIINKVRKKKKVS